jgi:hypothetical protein
LGLAKQQGQRCTRQSLHPQLTWLLPPALLPQRAGGAGETEFCTSTLPAHFASVVGANSRAVSQAAPPALPSGERGFVPQFVAGTRTGGSGPPGFPSLHTIKTGAELRRAGVNVFGMASRKESIILLLKPLHVQLGGQRLGAEQVAGALLGQRCWVKWPYLQEAVVEAVSDAGACPSTGPAHDSCACARLCGCPSRCPPTPIANPAAQHTHPPLTRGCLQRRRSLAAQAGRGTPPRRTTRLRPRTGSGNGSACSRST